MKTPLTADSRELQRFSRIRIRHNEERVAALQIEITDLLIFARQGSKAAAMSIELIEFLHSELLVAQESLNFYRRLVACRTQEEFEAEASRHGEAMQTLSVDRDAIRRKSNGDRLYDMGRAIVLQ